MPTKYVLFYDDTLSKPYSFVLEDDDGVIVARSTKNYKTKSAAAGVAARMLLTKG